MLSDVSLQESFRAAGAPLLPMVRLLERLARKAYAQRTAAFVREGTLFLGDEEGRGLSVTYWPHLRTFQVRVWDRAAGTLDLRHTHLLRALEAWVDELLQPA